MKRKRRYFREDLRAMRIADRYGLVEEYKTARRHGMRPLEALEEWDMLKAEDYVLFERR